MGRKTLLKGLLFAQLGWLVFSPVALAEQGTTETDATDLQFRVVDHILFSNEAEPLDPEAPNKTVLMHENYIQSQYGNYDFGIQFTNRLAPGDVDDTRPFVLEKVSAGLETDDWQVKLGDSSQEIGRGLALSLQRDDAFGLNTTLQGASATHNPGDLEVSAFAGRINTLSNPVAINPLEDPLQGDQVYLAGAQVSSTLTENSNFGLHYFFAGRNPEEETTRTLDRTWHTVGVKFSQESLFENVDLYVESNALFQRRLAGDSYQSLATGTASYASLTWSPSPWQVTYEVKDYREYGFPFRRAPTLEADIVETAHEDNTIGNRLMVAHKNLRAKTNYYASFLLGRDRVINKNIHHGVIGAQFPGFTTSSFEMRAGYRTLPEDSNLAHASLLSKFKTGKGQSFELSASKQYSNTNLGFLPTALDQNKLDLTYTFSKQFNLTVGYEYVPTNEVAFGQHFANVGAVVTTGALITRAFVGKTSGGTVCSGGVCRVVPPYQGARVETLYTF